MQCPTTAGFMVPADYMLPADSALPAAASDETYLPSGPAGDAGNDVTVTPTTGTGTVPT